MILVGSGVTRDSGSSVHSVIIRIESRGNSKSQAKLLPTHFSHIQHSTVQLGLYKLYKVTMEGCYKVEENINFESFLRVMGVTEEEQIQRMMAATKEVIVIIIIIIIIIITRLP